jgi:hypothetical protein
MTYLQGKKPDCPHISREQFAVCQLLCYTWAESFYDNPSGNHYPLVETCTDENRSKETQR